MTRVDFVVAFFLVLVTVSFAVIFISTNLENDFNYFNFKKTEKDADNIVKQLFETFDNNSLVSEFKMIKIRFDDFGGVAHQTDLDIQISPSVNNIHVYDTLFNEITSSVNNTGVSNVTFPLDFAASERKYVNIIFEEGSAMNVEYTSNITVTNVTSVIVSEKTIPVISGERCAQLQGMTPLFVRGYFGFTENFRIDNECVFNSNPPDDVNVVVRTVPIFVEQGDGTIMMKNVRIMVW